MATKIICDICNKNEASREFQVRKSLKGCWEGTSNRGRWNSDK